MHFTCNQFLWTDHNRGTLASLYDREMSYCVPRGLPTRPSGFPLGPIGRIIASARTAAPGDCAGIGRYGQSCVTFTAPLPSSELLHSCSPASSPCRRSQDNSIAPILPNSRAPFKAGRCPSYVSAWPRGPRGQWHRLRDRPRRRCDLQKPRRLPPVPFSYVTFGHPYQQPHVGSLAEFHED